MAFDTEKQVYTGAAVDRAELDEGLRKHMLRVYNYMMVGLGLTGITAYVVVSTPALYGMIIQDIPGVGKSATPLFWVLAFLPLAFYLVMGFGIHRMRFTTALVAFFAFATAMGFSMAILFDLYTSGSIARVFFITAGAFAGLSIFGYTTKKDLTGWGSFLLMGLIGLLIAIVVSWFFPSGMLMFLISVVGVLIFAGLTAYDTQRIKESYAEHHDGETAGKLAVMGAAELYWDFIMMFRFLLLLLGSRE